MNVLRGAERIDLRTGQPAKVKETYIVAVHTKNKRKISKKNSINLLHLFYILIFKKVHCIRCDEKWS